MTAPEKPLIPPKLLDIAQKVWVARTSDAATHPGGRGFNYYKDVWTLFFGPRAMAVLTTVPDAQQVVVGRSWWPDGHERHRGRLDRWEVMGVPVVEDHNGPLDLWRLAEGDGTTITWGELRP